MEQASMQIKMVTTITKTEGLWQEQGARVGSGSSSRSLSHGRIAVPPRVREIGLGLEPELILQTSGRRRLRARVGCSGDQK